MITREDCFKVGEVAKTHNLQGEVVITTDSDLLEKYANEPVFLLLDGAPVPFFIADEGLTVRNHTSYIVKFDYVDTLAQAGRLVGCEVLFEKELLEGQEPEESGYDIFELIGFEVKDQVSEETGEVADVADYSGNVVLTVSIMNKEILLPLSENYICEIDSSIAVAGADSPGTCRIELTTLFSELVPGVLLLKTISVKILVCFISVIHRNYILENF